jgi:hypothetical protein
MAVVSLDGRWLEVNRSVCRILGYAEAELLVRHFHPDDLSADLSHVTLTTASGSSVSTINGGNFPGCDVFWQVGSSATLGTATAFEGHILALTSISLDTGATILDGSALARNGAVTLDSNTIDNCISPNATNVPLPNSAVMGVTLLLPLAFLARRRFARDRE